MLIKSGFKKILTFLLVLVISLSPVFVTGCFWDNNNQSNTTIQPTTPSGGGGGNGGNVGGGSNNSNQEKRTSLSRDQYDDYFKNYRITYQTNNQSRTDFNNQIISQNEDVAEDILNNIKDSYSDKSMFYGTGYDIKTIYANNESGPQLIYNNSIVTFTNDNDNYSSFFSHKIDDIDFYEKKLVLAITLVLQGYDVLNKDGSINQEFDNLYVTQCNLLLNADGSIKDNDAFNNLANNVSHLGFTVRDNQQIENFVLHYVIGTELVKEDDKKFVNCYYDESSGNPKIEVAYYGGDNRYSNSSFNKFLTDETYATGYLTNFNNNLEFGLNGSEDQSLQGLLYYAGYYLASMTAGNDPSNVNSLVIDSYIGDYDIEEGKVIANKVTDPSTMQSVASAIYNKLIKMHRDTFNANVWHYDEYGNIDSPEAGNLVVDKQQGHVLFSVRLPGFKNFTSTVHQIVKNQTNSAPSYDNLQNWQNDYGYEYPFKDNNGNYIKYPNIPYTYFADYDNNDMLFDGVTGVAKMFSGFQCYQNMVLMPQSAVDLKDGAIFVTRKLVEDEAHYPDGSTDHSGDFEMTVYARYYDAETKSYATWKNDDTMESSEYYKIGTKIVEYKEYTMLVVDEEAMQNAQNEQDVQNATKKVLNYVPTTFNFSIKDILLLAEINGTQKTSWTLDPFADNKGLKLHNQQLVTKYNYGECFREDYTPEGNKVVVYDGKSVGSSSYFELVFSCSKNIPFQFCFYPIVAYAPQN